MMGLLACCRESWRKTTAHHGIHTTNRLRRCADTRTRRPCCCPSLVTSPTCISILLHLLDLLLIRLSRVYFRCVNVLTLPLLSSVRTRTHACVHLVHQPTNFSNSRNRCLVKKISRYVWPHAPAQTRTTRLTCSPFPSPSFQRAHTHTHSQLGASCARGFGLALCG